MLSAQHTCLLSHDRHTCPSDKTAHINRPFIVHDFVLDDYTLDLHYPHCQRIDPRSYMWNDVSAVVPTFSWHTPHECLEGNEVLGRRDKIT